MKTLNIVVTKVASAVRGVVMGSALIISGAAYAEYSVSEIEGLVRNSASGEGKVAIKEATSSLTDASRENLQVHDVTEAQARITGQLTASNLDEAIYHIDQFRKFHGYEKGLYTAKLMRLAEASDRYRGSTVSREEVRGTQDRIEQQHVAEMVSAESVQRSKLERLDYLCGVLQDNRALIAEDAMVMPRDVMAEIKKLNDHRSWREFANGHRSPAHQALDVIEPGAADRVKTCISDTFKQFEGVTVVYDPKLLDAIASEYGA